MGKYKVYRACPVCKSNNAEFIHQIEFALFEGHPMDKGYTLVQCEKCSFIYADTHVTQEALDVYYKEFSKYEDKKIGTGGGFTPEDKDRLSRAANFIKNNIADKNVRVVDIGCANGGLLKELKNVGFTNLVGVDPSLSCVEITKAEVGCESHQYSIFDIDKSLGKFDLIVLSHVLEHILDLPLIMDQMSSLLNDGGFVYVECPNAENYYKVIHAPYQEFNTEHINHFTETSFENLFGLHGYNKLSTGNIVLKIVSGQDYHAVYGLFKKESSAYKIKRDDHALENVLRYIESSEDILQAIREKVSSIAQGKTIALYGIGQFAFKFLALPEIKNRDLILFDNNTLNVGKTINSNPVLNAKTIEDEFLKEEFIVIISSLIHEGGIRKQIESSFKKGKVPVIMGFQNLLKLVDVN